jgi:hypothetical protein
MEIKIVPETAMVEATEPEVRQDPNDPTTVHVSYYAKLKPTGRFNISISGATGSEVQGILSVAEKLSKKKISAGRTETPAQSRMVPDRIGVCGRCGEPRQVNSKSLCYRCHVNTNLEAWAKSTGSGWKIGDPHPDWCDCQGLGEHKSRDGKTSRGMN